VLAWIWGGSKYSMRRKSRSSPPITSLLRLLIIKSIRLHRTGRAILIRALLTQAILYGSNPENPLHFSFPPEVDAEALMTGAEGLSRAVLESGTCIILAATLNMLISLAVISVLRWCGTFIPPEKTQRLSAQITTSPLSSPREKIGSAGLYVSSTTMQHSERCHNAAASVLLRMRKSFMPVISFG
jgi:hypothetical protein